MEAFVFEALFPNKTPKQIFESPETLLVDFMRLPFSSGNPSTLVFQDLRVLRFINDIGKVDLTALNAVPTVRLLEHELLETVDNDTYIQVSELGKRTLKWNVSWHFFDDQDYYNAVIEVHKFKAAKTNK